MKFLKKIILLFNLVLVVGLLFSYLSPHYDPNKVWFFSIFGLFYPVLLLANVAMVIFWLLVEFKYLFFSLLAILLGWSHLQGFVNFSKLNGEQPEITVMSYNVSFFFKGRKGGKQEAKYLKSIKQFFREHKDVDVFCIQESNKFSRDLIRQELIGYYSHEVEHKGTFIFSRFPIEENGQLEFGTKTNSCLWANIKHPTQKFRLYTMHLQSNKVSKDAVEVIDNANIQERKTWKGVKGILNKYSSTSRRRAKQAALISSHASKSPLPTIICGDLNDPPTSYTYNKLSEGYQDSFVETGSGIGTTYAGRIPMLRIDYIFADKRWKIDNFKVLKERFSDHYPIKGTYRFAIEN